MSRRGDEWEDFSDLVWQHVENYTVTQYGDAPDDFAEDYSPGLCVEHILRYARRFGSNQRPGERLRDLLKIAHYACLAHGKLERAGPESTTEAQRAQRKEASDE